MYLLHRAVLRSQHTPSPVTTRIVHRGVANGTCIQQIRTQNGSIIAGARTASGGEWKPEAHPSIPILRS